MRVPWKSTVPILCIVLISGAAVTWQTLKVKSNGLRHPQDASVCRVCAEQGDAEAQAKLGYVYSHGQGVPLDYSEAIRWYQKAADQGYAKAQNALGLMYYLGQGVPRDYTEAVRWYRKAADQGNARSQYNLGTMYYYGEGVSQDRVEADRWYQKAADQGDEYAQRALGLRGAGLSSWGAVSLLAVFIGCLWALKDSVLRRQRPRDREKRQVNLAGVFGLAYVGLSLYGAFGVFKSVSAVNACYFAESLMAGISMAIYSSVFGRKGAKVILSISGILLIGINLLVIAHHDFTRFATTIRGFSVVNGFLLGTIVTFLWLEAIARAKGSQDAA